MELQDEGMEDKIMQKQEREQEQNAGEKQAALLKRQQQFRSYARQLCSFLGFSLCLLFIILQMVAFALGWLGEFLKSHAVMGVGAELYRMLYSDWFTVAGSSLLAYAVAVPILERVMRLVPETRAQPKKMHLSKFLMFFVLCMGGGYVFNFAGNIINLFLAGLTGRNTFDMQPISSVVADLNWTTALYIGVIAPVIEEYIFRGLILNRVRPLGEKAAIVFSAFLFGLLHGNISQFLYATAIGMVLGYVAVKTGTIFYSSILHMMVNSYSVILAAFLSSAVFSHEMTALYSVMLISLLSILMTVAACVIFILRQSRTRLLRGDWPEGVVYRDFSSAMFLNSGVIVFSVICFALMLFYAFWA